MAEQEHIRQEEQVVLDEDDEFLMVETASTSSGPVTQEIGAQDSPSPSAASAPIPVKDHENYVEQEVADEVEAERVVPRQEEDDEEEEEEDEEVHEDRKFDDETLSMPRTADFHDDTSDAGSGFADEFAANIMKDLFQTLSAFSSSAFAAPRAQAPASTHQAPSSTVEEEHIFGEFRALARDRQIVDAVQQFLALPVVADAIVTIAEADTLQEGLPRHMGDLLIAIGDLIKHAPQLALAAPMLFSSIFNLKKMSESAEPASATTAPAVQPARAEEIPKPDEQPQDLVVHRLVWCDGCETDEQKAKSLAEGNRTPDSFIRGIRWKSAITQDFDLCSTCEATGNFEEEHGPFLKVTEPRKCPREMVVVLRDETRSTVRPRCGRGRGGRCRRGGNNNQCNSSSEKAKNEDPNPFDKLECPDGHKVKEFKAPNMSFSCDVCGKRVQFQAVLYGCRGCNWDMCRDCASQQIPQQTPSAPPPQFAGTGVPVSFSKIHPTPVPVSTEPAPATPQAPVRPQGKFIADVSLPDGSVVQPGDRLTKTWRMQNPSETNDWPQGVRLVFVGGDRMGGPEDGMLLPAVRRGGSLDINLNLIAPEAPGRYVGYWRLMTADNQRFGHRLWIDLTIARKWDKEISQLEEMGFVANPAILEMLEEEQGNLDNIIPRLCC